MRKSNPGICAELVNIKSTAPMEIVCVDYLSLERSKGGIENVLVITDHFSRYAQAFPMRNQTAKTTARFFLTSSLCIMASQLDCTVIRVKTLRAS